MMATPNSDTKPTAAEMLKLVPVRYSAQMPPMARARTLLSTTTASRNERKAVYSRMKIRPSDSGMMISKRPSASSISSNSPLQTAR